MALLQVVLFLMMSAVALGWVARHFKFPYPIALVIGGGALGFVPRLPQLEFDPQFLLVLVLPPILYQGALLTSWHEFKANIRPIGTITAVSDDSFTIELRTSSGSREYTVTDGTVIETAEGATAADLTEGATVLVRSRNSDGDLQAVEVIVLPDASSGG